MVLSQVDRMSAVILAKTIANTHSMLEFRARSGVKSRHLDHLIRMVGSQSFAKLHTKSLIDDGATFSALSRVTGISESSLRRYAREES